MYPTVILRHSTCEANGESGPRAHVVLLSFLASLITYFAAAPVFAQSDGANLFTSAVRLIGPIEMDGRVDEDAWTAIDPIPLVQHIPTFDGPLSERTEMRLAYDDDFLYVSARCPDSADPTMNTSKRDEWNDENDQIALSIDSFNDHENALVFVLYPTGARVDAAFSNDARNVWDANTDWNTFWDGATSVTDEGWSGEMRIPWSSLRFEPDADGRATMGVILYRYIARNQELQIYPEIPPDWGFWSFVKPSKGRRTQFDGLSAKRPLYVTPYVTGGLGQDFRLNSAETAYIRSDDPTYDAGLDLKYGITSNMTLDVTVNTDFAQVEADNQQVNLTRFSLFFPEKRQFFLERTSNFDFGFGGFDRVFYSRRIGLYEGRQIRLLGGSRLVGRAGDWDVGALTLQTGRDRGLPSENFSVVRLKRGVLNPNSYIGQIVTSRIDEHGRFNAVYGVDGVLNVAGDDYLRVAWAQSFETDAPNRLASLHNVRARLLWQRARQTGLAYELGVSRAGAAYRPGVGFQRRIDYTELAGDVGYGWRPDAPSPISAHAIQLMNSAFFRNADGSIETGQFGASYQASLRSGYEFTGGLIFSYEDLVHDFRLAEDAGIPAGEYRYVTGELSVGTPAGRAARLSTNVEAGSFFDGRQLSVMLRPTWNASSRFNLSGTYRYDRIRFPDRGESFDAHLVGLRADVSLSTRTTLSSFLQLNSTVDAASANIRFRYNPREGNDFYLVYNEGLNTDRSSGDPLLPLTSSRTIIAKYTYTFLW